MVNIVDICYRLLKCQFLCNGQIWQGRTYKRVSIGNAPWPADVWQDHYESIRNEDLKKKMNIENKSEMKIVSIINI